MNTTPRDAFWQEYTALSYMKPINRRWPRVRRYVLSGYPWRRFNPLRISDWRKRAEYRRWLKKWGLK